MRAMTWWDHETKSIWSQPWGMAIDGPLKGTSLELLPAGVMPWAAWLEDHPDTLVLSDAAGGLFEFARERFSPDYVIGEAIGEHAKAYPFRSASKEGVVNDRMGPFPIVVLADAETKAVHVYLRVAGGRELEFVLRDGRLEDVETGTVWSVSRGLAIEGRLKGELLRQVPYSTAFDWAWEDFYPDTETYGDGADTTEAPQFPSGARPAGLTGGTYPSKNS